jgi:hypothetical protein
MVNRRIAGVGGSEFCAMGWGRILPVMVILSASGAAAQTPWPTQQQSQQQQAPWPAQQQSQPQPQGQAAWPAQQPQQSQGTPAWPQHHQAAAPGAPMGAPAMSPVPGMMSPMGAPGGGQPPPCFAEFTKLRTDVEKHGAAAKAANERHVQREEFCKLITALSAASNRWFKFTVAKAKECGIPSDAVTQIKGQDEHLAGLKKQVCSAGPAGPGAAPSLAEALGTDKMPLDDNEKTNVKRGGVLDSLTGAPIR